MTLLEEIDAALRHLDATSKGNQQALVQARQRLADVRDRVVARDASMRVVVDAFGSITRACEAAIAAIEDETGAAE